MQSPFRRLSLAQQFLMVSFPVLLAGSLSMGWWIGHEVEDGVVHRIGSVTALYVDSFVAPHLQTLVTQPDLTPEDRAALAADLAGTPLGKKVLSLKIWAKDGRVLFSTDTSVIGKRFPIDEGLAVALEGNIFSEISFRSAAQQAEHGQLLPRLIETYTPIHADRTGEVIAAAEFYETPDELDRVAGAAQRSSWLRVAAIMLVMYLSLFLLVRRGSQTIATQQTELGDKVRQLTALNQENLALQERVISAADRATAFNEDFLRRVSADLHDGPAQDLGFALMQIKNIHDASLAGQEPLASDGARNLQQARLAIESALKDLRAMSADIELPDIARLRVADIAARVVRDYQSKTDGTVELRCDDTRLNASFRVKVALYRLLQESLANTFRHATKKHCRVRLQAHGEQLEVEVCDDGPGFDPAAVAAKGRLGLPGMRQRVEVLGGVFKLTTAPGQATCIWVSLPLAGEKEHHA